MKPALEKGAQEITEMQKRLVPVDSGALRNSIGYTFGTYRPDNANVRGVAAGFDGDADLSVTIHAGDAVAWYAKLVEFGVSPHTAGGKFKGAKHPGTAPNGFFYAPARSLAKRVKARVSRAMSKAVKAIANE